MVYKNAEGDEKIKIKWDLIIINIINLAEFSNSLLFMPTN